MSCWDISGFMYICKHFHTINIWCYHIEFNLHPEDDYLNELETSTERTFFKTPTQSNPDNTTLQYNTDTFYS